MLYRKGKGKVVLILRNSAFGKDFHYNRWRKSKEIKTDNCFSL